jgi:ADP-ribose pyrophosphatase YjhB (NUDIX family)
MVGGGVHAGETLSEAIERHVRTTLGDDVHHDAIETAQPGAVGEYLPVMREGYGFDPSKHAIAVSYIVELSGRVEPRDEALDFSWFKATDIPPPEEIGFGHHLVIARLLEQTVRTEVGST